MDDCRSRETPVSNPSLPPARCKSGNAVLSEQLLRFIQASIKSVWAVEVLLLLRRDAARSWRVEDLTRELRSSLLIVADALMSFKALGLVDEDAERLYRYRPATPELDDLVSELAKAYAEAPVAVTETIFSAPDRKLRLFADAFRLKKD
jgi:hypothetical protein